MSGVFKLILLLILFSGCSRVINQPQTTPPRQKPVEVQIPVAQPPADDLLPEERQPAINQIEFDFQQKAENNKYSLQLAGGDLKEVLLALVKNSDFGMVVDSSISATVPLMDLKDITLREILDLLLIPNNLTYYWKGKNIYVIKKPLQTRYFTFDYLALMRKGKRQVAFSTRSNEGGGGMGGGSSASGMSSGSMGSGMGGSGGGQNQTTNEITADYENTVWKTFVESLQAIIFGTVSGGAQSQSSSTESEKIRSFSQSNEQGKTLVISPETGIVMVTGNDNDFQRVAEFIEQFSGAVLRQVWIEARILEVNLYKGYQMGIDWGMMLNRGKYYGILDSKRTITSPALSFTPQTVNEQSLNPTYGVFQMAFSNNMIDFLLDALSRQGNVKVLASPRISTLNNEKAVIRVVREEAFFSLETQISQGTGGNVAAPSINVQIVPVGIVMDIVPQINANGDIILSINPDISELLEVKKFEVQGAMAMQPVIDRRSIDTIARLKDGETLVIAGIIKEKKSEVVRGVPFLYKLPLIGNLFRRTEQVIDRTELVILITPKVVSGKSARELTSEEIERLKRANLPLRLGDVAPLKEGVQGELKDLKKDDD